MKDERNVSNSSKLDLGLGDFNKNVENEMQGNEGGHRHRGYGAG